MSVPPADAPPPPAPGSKAWVEQHYGRSADFADRIGPGVVDVLLSGISALIPIVLGIALIISGIPETYPCGAVRGGTCDVPGTGSGALVAAGVMAVLLGVVAAFAVTLWNRVWRVTRTGRSVGKQLFGLEVIDAHTGALPQLGPALVRELVHQFAGIVSWLWMLVDNEDRTLSDIVGRTHVIHDRAPR